MGEETSTVEVEIEPPGNHLRGSRPGATGAAR
jgi:hypothetical protein